jgi:hypothetical protein
MTAVRKISGVEDHRRVRMMKLCHRPRFAQKTISNVGVARELAFDDLYCDRSFKSEMGGEVDSSHAAGPDFSFDPEPSSDELGDIHIRPSFGLKGRRRFHFCCWLGEEAVEFITNF